MTKATRELIAGFANLVGLIIAVIGGFIVDVGWGIVATGIAIILIATVFGEG